MTSYYFIDSYWLMMWTRMNKAWLEIQVPEPKQCCHSLHRTPPMINANKALGALDAASAALLKLGQKSWGAALRILARLKVVQVVGDFNIFQPDLAWSNWTFCLGWVETTSQQLSLELRARPRWTILIFLGLSTIFYSLILIAMESRSTISIASRKSLWSPGHRQWFDHRLEILLPDGTPKYKEKHLSSTLSLISANMCKCTAKTFTGSLKTRAMVNLTQSQSTKMIYVADLLCLPADVFINHWFSWGDW